MISLRAGLVLATVVAGVVYVIAFARGLLTARRDGERVSPRAWETAVGATTNFFDALGIGSFATTATLYRLPRRKTIDDRLLPGTLNVGHTIPSLLEAFIFIDKVEVEPWTLLLMIAAAILGAVTGAPIVARLSRTRVQLGIGSALLVLAGLIVWRQLGLPGDGTSIGLSGAALAFAVGANFVFGALMTIGVGLYAPCLVVVSLLGMSPRSAFPIMMGSCAFLQCFGSIPFIRQKSFAPGASVGLALGGVPAVLVAAFLVRELPLRGVKWLVAGVVVYTGASLLLAARRGATASEPALSPPEA
jgi:uncharacterized membrane protein YfcA